MRPTITQLKAIATALDAALAGDGFDGGDFDGMDANDFQTALDWANAELQAARERALKQAGRKRR